MIEAFGTNKQKRALSSRRLNQVGSDTLHQAVAKAANTVIDQKGLEGKLHSCIEVMDLKVGNCQLLSSKIDLKER